MARTTVRILLGTFLLAGLALVVQTPAYAQGATAALTGQVVDETGAVIPAVKLTLENPETQQIEETESNEIGYYRFSFLRPSTYVLTAEITGFTTATFENIVLQVNQTDDITVTLRPSAVQEQVTVTAAAVSLSTQTSELSEVITERSIKQLPLKTRDPSYMVSLVPGVTADHRQQSATGGRSGLMFVSRLDFVANGGIRAQASAMVDGVDVTVSNGGFNFTPIIATPDITQEFQVMTNNYSAEFSRANVVVNVVTKSGTNEFHGVVFDFLQNDNLNANNFFLNRDGVPKAEARRNQFGVAGGGPIIKNKLWFFGDWEKMIQGRALPIVSRMPDSRELSGDYGDLFTTAGDPINVYNPFDTFVDAADDRVKRRPFANNQIPASLINPFGQNVGAFWASPTSSGLPGPNGERTNIANLNIAGTSAVSLRRWDTKFDYQMSQNHKFMGRYSASVLLLPIVRVYNNEAESASLSNRNDTQPGENAVFSWTWTASPSLLITQALNYSYFLDFTPRVEGALGFDVASLGGPFTPEVVAYAKQWGGDTAFPVIAPTGYGRLGDNIDQIIDMRHVNYSYQVGIIKMSGSHTFKTGFHAERRETNQEALGGMGGTFNFSGEVTNGPDPLLPSANTGHPIADLMLGLPRSGSLDTGFTTATKNYRYGVYFQDDWRVTPRLTLNLGLRYDLEQPFVDRFDHFAQLDRTVRSPIADAVGPNTNGQTLDQYFQNLVGRPLLGGLAFPSVPGYSRGIDDTDWTNFSPRLGFAYRATNKLVIRGGLAKIYSLNPNTAAVPAIIPPGNAATTPVVGTIDGIHPNVTIDDPFPFGLNVPEFDKNGLATQLGQRMWAGGANGVARTPYSWQWNFGFQYELPDRSVLGVAYAGSRNHNLTCPFFFCSDQIAEKDFTSARERVFDTVPNPFFGIITDPTSALSGPEVQLGQLMKQNPTYTETLNAIPPWKGPGVDTFNSSFESMQVSYKKTTGDLTLMLAYTLSKNMTNVDSFENGYLGPSAGYQNNVDFEGERSLSSEDTTHRMGLGWVYTLPFGRGKRFGSSGMNPVLDKVVGGWELGAFVIMASGFPLNRIGVTPDLTGSFATGFATTRSNLVGDPCLSTSRPRGEEIAQWVNPNAFAAPEPFAFGTAPRTLSCRGDGIKNFDLTLTKHIPIKESVRAEFRGEFFNVFNRPQFKQPNMTFGGGSFGQMTAQENLPRTIQLVLKLHF